MRTRNYIPGSPNALANYRRRKERRENNRQRALSFLGNRCVKCGSSTNLEFDHIDRTTKEFNVTELLDCSWERLREEVIKCQLLCGNNKCHADKSYEQGDSPGKRAIHGSLAMYRHHKCRCEDCKEANRKYGHSYFEKNRETLNEKRRTRRKKKES